MIDEPEATVGPVEPELATEFPELGIAYAALDARARRSPEEVLDRLRHASDRFTGGMAVMLRQQPVPWAYRVFYRHVGIDPDQERTPIEAIALERMRAGGFVSAGLIEDALLLATLETGVPVQAFDAGAVEEPVGLRLGRAGEQLDEHHPLGGREIVIADARRPLAVLFRDVASDCAVRRSTRRVVLAAVRVKGVPAISVEEALWVARETLAEAAN